MGLYVPVVIAATSGSVDPPSSNVSVTALEITLLPPVSDINRTFSPPGPTISTSMSSGYWCVRPFSRTFTFSSRPITPLTAIVDGYVNAAPTTGMLIALMLLRVCRIWNDSVQPSMVPTLPARSSTM